MIWTSAKIRERLFRYWEYREYCADYRPYEEWVGIPKRKRVSFEPRFVFQAMDNAMFEEAFSLLDSFQQWLLLRLYMDGGEDVNTLRDMKGGQTQQLVPDIRTRDEIFEEIVKETNLMGREINAIASGAIDRMLECLNG